DVRNANELSERCLALYTLALAGRSEPAYHESLFKARDLLSMESRSMLALAILESKGPKSMVDDLLRSRPSQRAAESDYFACSARDTAVLLLAWARHQSAAATVDALADELMREQVNAHWGTTQAN